MFRVLDGFKVDTWLDRNRLVGGDVWLPAINDEIATRDHFFFIATPESLARKGVLEEELRLIHLRLLYDSNCRLIPVFRDVSILPNWMLQHQGVQVNGDLERSIYDIVCASNQDFNRGAGEVYYNPVYKRVRRVHEASVIEYDLPAVFLAGQLELSDDVNRAIEGRVIEMAIGQECTNRQESIGLDWVRRSVFRIKEMFASENVVSLLIAYSHSVTQDWGASGYTALNFDLRTGNFYSLADALNLRLCAKDLAIQLEVEIPNQSSDDISLQIDVSELIRRLNRMCFLVNDRGLVVFKEDWHQTRATEFGLSDLGDSFAFEWSGFAQHFLAKS